MAVLTSILRTKANRTIQSPSATSSKHKENMNRKVSFDSISIYEFPIRMGENPACSAGCPIALDGFDHTKVEYQSLEEYTKQRQLDKRKHRSDLTIPTDVRTKMLIVAGYQFEDIVMGTTSMLCLQAERKKSLEKGYWDNEIRSFVFRLRLPFLTVPNSFSKKLSRSAQTAG